MALKTRRWLESNNWMALAAAGLLAMAGPSPGAESDATSAPSSEGVVKVKATQGRVQFSRKDGPFVPVASATVLRPGDVVRTATGSAVDLDFGAGPGTIRLPEGTMLAIEKLTLPAQAGGTFEVELTLRSGELLGALKDSPGESRFEVKTVSGIARPLRGEFRVSSRGFLVLLEGKAIFAYVPVGGEPGVHTLTAPPASYFTPAVGVQPAPKSLIKEVRSQLKAKLKREQ